MKFFHHYLNLHTDLKEVYAEMLLNLKENKNLGILSELKGDTGGKTFRTIIAFRKEMPRAFVGALREVIFTIIGGSDDFVIEVHTSSWYNYLIIPGTTGVLFGTGLGPPGMAAGVVMGSETCNTVGVIYHRNLSNKVMDLVEKYSMPPSIQNIEYL